MILFLYKFYHNCIEETFKKIYLLLFKNIYFLQACKEDFIITPI